MSGLIKPVDLAEFQELLRINQKVVAAFVGNGSPFLGMLIYHIERLAEQYTDIVFLAVDINRQHDIKFEYGIDANPALIFFKNGEKVDELISPDYPGYEQKIRDVFF